MIRRRHQASKAINKSPAIPQSRTQKNPKKPRNQRNPARNRPLVRKHPPTIIPPHGRVHIRDEGRKGDAEHALAVFLVAVVQVANVLGAVQRRHAVAEGAVVLELLARGREGHGVDVVDDGVALGGELGGAAGGELRGADDAAVEGAFEVRDQAAVEDGEAEAWVAVATAVVCVSSVLPGLGVLSRSMTYTETGSGRRGPSYLDPRTKQFYFHRIARSYSHGRHRATRKI